MPSTSKGPSPRLSLWEGRHTPDTTTHLGRRLQLPKPWPKQRQIQTIRIENAPACYRALRWPDQKNTPSSRNSGNLENIHRKYQKIYRKNTPKYQNCLFFLLGGGYFGVICRGSRISAWGEFFRYFYGNSGSGHLNSGLCSRRGCSQHLEKNRPKKKENLSLLIFSHLCHFQHWPHLINDSSHKRAGSHLARRLVYKLFPSCGFVWFSQRRQPNPQSIGGPGRVHKLVRRRFVNRPPCWHYFANFLSYFLSFWVLLFCRWTRLLQISSTSESTRKIAVETWAKGWQ